MAHHRAVADGAVAQSALILRAQGQALLGDLNVWIILALDIELNLS
jgi:hypothetical protein